MDQFTSAFEDNGVKEHHDAPNQHDISDYLEGFNYDLFLDQPLVALPAHSENTLPPIYTNEYQRLFAEGFSQENQQEEPAFGAPYSVMPPESHTSQESIVPLPRLTYQPVVLELCKEFRPQVQGMQDFQNKILKYFVYPYTPIRIIDEVAFPFHHNIEEALQQELKTGLEDQPAATSGEQQSFVALSSISTLPDHDHEALSEREVAISQTARSAIPIAIPLPLPRFISTTAKIPCNKRSFNLAFFDHSKFYPPLASIPSSWRGPEPLVAPYFSYISNGEFAPTFTFTIETFTHYLAFHPLHSNSQSYSQTNKNFSTKTSPLKLWIQTAPADSGKRYKSTSSARCCFACCPRKERTIYKGEFRIALDKLLELNPKHDPFVNAGYVHLFCLEKVFDFPSICKSFNVQPDIRTLPEGKNKMAITRDHASLNDICLEFIDSSLPWIEFGAGDKE